jgi:3-dehydroquinate synthase
VPSSAVSVSAGMLLSTPFAFLACFLGLSAGALLGYGFGYYFRRMHFERWYKDDEFRTLSVHLSRYGLVVLLICRGIPILAELSVMVAGFHRYSFRKFLGIVTLGNLLLAFLYSVIGDQVADVTSAYVLAAVFLSIPMITYAARLLWLRGIEKA